MTEKYQTVNFNRFTSMLFLYFSKEDNFLDFLSASPSKKGSTLEGKRQNRLLTLKAPITTAADDIHKYFYIVF